MNRTSRVLSPRIKKSEHVVPEKMKNANFAPKDFPADTELKKHVVFFSDDGKKVTLKSGARGIQDLGFDKNGIDLAISYGLSAFINLGLAKKTNNNTSKTVVNVDNIHLAKHDSDTDGFDKKGKKNAAKVAQIFGEKTFLTKKEVNQLLKKNRETVSGGIASFAEFRLFFMLDKSWELIDGKLTEVLTRDSVEKLFAGDEFSNIARRRGRRP